MTKDEIIEMAREAGFYNHTPMYFDDEMLVAFAKLVATKERENCAKVCDELSVKHTWEGCYANECAETIRAKVN